MSPARSREPLERDTQGRRILTHDRGGYARGCGCDNCRTDHTAYRNERAGKTPAVRKIKVTPRLADEDKRSVIIPLGLYPGRDGRVRFRLRPREASNLATRTTDPAGYLRSLLAGHGITGTAGLGKHAADAGKSRGQYARDILLDALNHQEGQPS